MIILKYRCSFNISFYCRKKTVTLLLFNWTPFLRAYVPAVVTWYITQLWQWSVQTHTCHWHKDFITFMSTPADKADLDETRPYGTSQAIIVEIVSATPSLCENALRTHWNKTTIHCLLSPNPIWRYWTEEIRIYQIYFSFFFNVGGFQVKVY